MGATTLYHPVSLHVIRGAAEFHNFKFGKIKQTRHDFKRCEAVYEAEIISMPKGLTLYSNEVIQRQLDHCFADDIQVTNVWKSKAGIYRARLEVKVQGVEQAEFPEIDTEPDFPF